MKKRYLVLKDKRVFEGYAFGADCNGKGELIFSTGIVGYVELLSDPSYYGQIVVQTFPMIGNYGITEKDEIGKPKLSGYVVREWCDYPSNFRSEIDIDTYLKKNGIPGISGVDTRELTNIIRDEGAMPALICDEIPDDISDLADYKIISAVEAVSDNETKEYKAQGETKGKVAILNLGSVKKLSEEFASLGYDVTVLPYNASADDILAVDADFLYLSEGPGDPSELTDVITIVKSLFGKIPMFGIGLGFNVIALAKEAEIIKLTYGHHGANQPSKIVGTDRTLITTQNHIYAVKNDSVSENEIVYRNMNDGTVEGVKFSDVKAMGIQFEANAEFIIEKIEELK